MVQFIAESLTFTLEAVIDTETCSDTIAAWRHCLDPPLAAAVIVFYVETYSTVLRANLLLECMKVYQLFRYSQDMASSIVLLYVGWYGHGYITYFSIAHVRSYERTGLADAVDVPLSWRSPMQDPFRCPFSPRASADDLVPTLHGFLCTCPQTLCCLCTPLTHNVGRGRAGWSRSFFFSPCVGRVSFGAPGLVPQSPAEAESTLPNSGTLEPRGWQPWDTGGTQETDQGHRPK